MFRPNGGEGGGVPWTHANRGDEVPTYLSGRDSVLWRVVVGEWSIGDDCDRGREGKKPGALKSGVDAEDEDDCASKESRCGNPPSEVDFDFGDASSPFSVKRSSPPATR